MTVPPLPSLPTSGIVRKRNSSASRSRILAQCSSSNSISGSAASSLRSVRARARAVRAAGRARPHRDRGRQGDRNSSQGRTHRARPAFGRQHVERASDLRGLHRTRAAHKDVMADSAKTPCRDVDRGRHTSSIGSNYAMCVGSSRRQNNESVICANGFGMRQSQARYLRSASSKSW